VPDQAHRSGGGAGYLKLKNEEYNLFREGIGETLCGARAVEAWIKGFSDMLEFI